MDAAFAPLHEELAKLEGLPVPWWVGGGWAIDLFVGRVTRDHQDVDLAIARTDQRAAYDHFVSDRSWSKIVPHPEGLSGQGTIEPWEGDYLELPTHQILAEDAGGRRIEFLLNEIDQWVWTSRRHPDVIMPLEGMATTSDHGIPYLSPEIVLLYKAKHLRDWDRADFATALPEMGLSRRHWLYHALEQAFPGHPWTDELGITE